MSGEWDIIRKSIGERGEEMAHRQKRPLVVYLTIPDTLSEASRRLVEATGGYLFPLEPAVSYLPEDFEPNRPRSRTRWESKSFTERPSIRDRLYFMEEFNTIYLGIAAWWYGIPRLVQSFLVEYDFAGKWIIPYTTKATPGAEELAEQAAVLAAAYPIPQWMPLTILAYCPIEKELNSWVGELSRQKKKQRCLRKKFGNRAGLDK